MAPPRRLGVRRAPRWPPRSATAAPGRVQGGGTGVLVACHESGPPGPATRWPRTCERVSVTSDLRPDRDATAAPQTWLPPGFPPQMPTDTATRTSTTECSFGAAVTDEQSEAEPVPNGGYTCGCASRSITFRDPLDRVLAGPGMSGAGLSPGLACASAHDSRRGAHAAAVSMSMVFLRRPWSSFATRRGSSRLPARR